MWGAAAKPGQLQLQIFFIFFFWEGEIQVAAAPTESPAPLLQAAATLKALQQQEQSRRGARKLQ